MSVENGIGEDATKPQYLINFYDTIEEHYLCIFANTTHIFPLKMPILVIKIRLDC